MSAVTYTAPTDDALAHIATHMRAADVEELRIMGRKDPSEAVFKSAEGSDAVFIAWHDGEPVAVLGVGAVDILRCTGAPWLLGTDGVEQCGRALLVDGRAAVRCWRTKYRLLQNAVSVSNELSVRWLSRIGFSFGTPARTPFGGYVMTFTMEGTRNV